MLNWNLEFTYRAVDSANVLVWSMSSVGIKEHERKEEGSGKMIKTVTNVNKDGVIRVDGLSGTVSGVFSL